MANPSTPEFVFVTAVHCGRARMHWTASVDENGQPPKQYEVVDAITGLNVSIIDGHYVYGTVMTDAGRAYSLRIRAVDTLNRPSALSTAVAYQAPGSTFTADLTWPGRLQMSSRHFDRWGATRGVLYYQTNFNNPWIRLIDLGTSVALSGSSSGIGTIGSSGIAFTSEDLFHYAYANRVDTYSLASGFQALQTFGTGIDIRDVIHLADGSVLAVFQDTRWDITANLTLHVALRSPAGAWTVKDVQVAIQQAASVIISASQHPVDGTIWLFLKQDAAHWMAAAKFNASLDLLSWVHDFIYYVSSPDPNGPNGEYPWLRSFPDPATNTIALAFTNEVSTIFSNSPQNYAGTRVPNFVKGAEITVARIAANGTKAYRYYPWMGERIAHFGYSCTGGVDRLMQAEIDLTDMSFQDCYARTWNGTAWTAPVFVAPTRGAALAFCEEYALVQAPDGSIYALAGGQENIPATVSESVRVQDFFGKGVVKPLAVHRTEAVGVSSQLSPRASGQLSRSGAASIGVAESRKAVVSPLATHPSEAITVSSAATALAQLEETPEALSKAVAQTVTVKDFFAKGVASPLAVHGADAASVAETAKVAAHLGTRRTDAAAVSETRKAVVSPLATHRSDAVDASDEASTTGFLRRSRSEPLAVSEFAKRVGSPLAPHRTEAATAADSVTALTEAAETPAALSKVLAQSVGVADLIVRGFISPLAVHGAEALSAAATLSPVSASPPIPTTETEIIVREIRRETVVYEEAGW